MRRRLQAFFPVLLFIVMWMASTVVFFLFSRYRLPAIPGLILLGAAAVGFIFTSWNQNRRQSVIVLILVFLVLVAPLLVKQKPKQDLVFYNLALVDEKMGETALAVQSYKNAYSINPNDFLSCINLGNLAAKEQSWPEALEWYKKAEAIESQSEGIHANIGSANVALGMYDEAEKAFDRALGINPENIEVLHNKAILLAMKKMFREALDINKKVLQLAPDWPPAIRFRERLDKILIKK